MSLPTTNKESQPKQKLLYRVYISDEDLQLRVSKFIEKASYENATLSRAIYMHFEDEVFSHLLDS